MLHFLFPGGLTVRTIGHCTRACVCVELPKQALVARSVYKHGVVVFCKTAVPYSGMVERQTFILSSTVAQYAHRYHVLWIDCMLIWGEGGRGEGKNVICVTLGERMEVIQGFGSCLVIYLFFFGGHGTSSWVLKCMVDSLNCCVGGMCRGLQGSSWRLSLGTSLCIGILKKVHFKLSSSVFRVYFGVGGRRNCCPDTSLLSF